MAAAAASLPEAESIDDNASVELALLATEHPEIQRFGRLVLEHARTASSLCSRCAAWMDSGHWPDEVLEAYRSLQVTTGVVNKEIERLDSIDFTELQKGWGDKATIRLARKGLIGFAERVLACLDQLQGRLTGPVATVKEKRREESTKQQSLSQEEDLSLEEKYSDKFRRLEEPPQQQQQEQRPPTATSRSPARTAGLPPAKRLRTATAQEVEEVLRRLQARVGKPLERWPVQTFRRQLTNLAALPELVHHAPLCRDGVECALGATQVALEEEPGAKALGTLLHCLQQLETLKDPSGLPLVLLDLADVLGTL